MSRRFQIYAETYILFQAIRIMENNPKMIIYILIFDSMVIFDNKYHNMKKILISSILILCSISFKINQINVDPQQCIQEKCPNEWAACQKDPKCVPALQDCQKKCGTGSTCWAFCLSREGDSAATAIAKCANSQGCLKASQVLQTAIATVDPQQCIQEKCPNEWAACQKDPKCIPTLQYCQKKCGTGSSCWASCLLNAGDKAATNVARCAQKNNCLGLVLAENEFPLQTAIATVDPQQCIQEKCPNEWAACQKDPKCVPALQDCQKKCGTSATCWFFCLNKEGDGAATAIAKCANSQGCLKASQVLQTAIATVDPLTCVQQNCPDEWAACQKDPKCLPALDDCNQKCGTNINCWTFCIPGKGSQAAIDAAKCGRKNNCLGQVLFENNSAHPFEICMSRSCFSQSLNCLSEEECRHSLLYCRDPQGVWLFSMQCLIHRSLSNEVLSSWFHCAGNRKCI